MKFELPRPACSTSVTVEEALKARRSVREYSDKPISIQVLSQLLWAAQGITGEGGKRAAPSAGAQYPLQIYVVVGAVAELPVGLYRYDGKSHSIHFVIGDDLREALRDAALEDQPWVGNAALVIVLTANFGAAQNHFRTQPPQGERGARYVYIETGAVAENVHLQAAGVGIGAVLVAGFDDAKIGDALHLPQELKPAALLCIGTGS